jgi:hypothetical protein
MKDAILGMLAATARIVEKAEVLLTLRPGHCRQEFLWMIFTLQLTRLLLHHLARIPMLQSVTLGLALGIGNTLQYLGCKARSITRRRNKKWMRIARGIPQYMFVARWTV